MGFGPSQGAAAGGDTLATGAAGGRVLVGGTGASDALTLRATSNATDGAIIFQTDPTTTRVQVLSTGRVLIGTNTDVGLKFGVSGSDATAYSAGSVLVDVSAFIFNDSTADQAAAEFWLGCGTGGTQYAKISGVRRVGAATWQDIVFATYKSGVATRKMSINGNTGTVIVGTATDQVGTELLLVQGESLMQGDVVLADAVNFRFGSTTGTRFGSALAKMGWFGAAPVAVASAYTQTYSTASRTHAAFTGASLVSFASGLFGFDTIATRDNLKAQFNAMQDDLANVKNVMNQIVDDGQAYGIYL